MTAVGVLVPLPPGPLAPPEDRPIGRAALVLEAEGHRVVFGDRLEEGRMWGFRAVPGRWVPAEAVEVAGVHDRYPSQKEAARYAEILASMGDVPLSNPPWLTLLCRDKLRCQGVLEEAGLDLPPLEALPGRFVPRLAEWGAAFLKPRYGAFGRGIRRVVPGDDLPAEGEGTLPGVIEPLLLQRAVHPPPGWAGISTRLNVQRLPGGEWHLNPAVARRSRTDPVVNAHRGAEVVPAGEVLDEAGLEAQALAAAEALAGLPGGEWICELGVDAVIDRDSRPWVVEVNSRPRGRLEALAERWGDQYEALHVEACARPLRFLVG